MHTEDLSVMILVKAAPVLTSSFEETMCVAAMTLGEDPEWIRLHPVPFRDLDIDSKFRKYQEIDVSVFRSRDRRPESWTPVEDTIRLGRTIDTAHHWAERKHRVSRLERHNMCDLVEMNRSGSGPDTPSLAVVRPIGPPRLVITEREESQVSKWRDRAKAIASQRSLFDDPGVERKPLEIIPWRFQYSYRCAATSCNGHNQTIVDWEAAALYRNVRHHRNWQEKMQQKFVEEMWTSERDSVLFVGNMEQRPWNFLVLGIFWPPQSSTQQTLL